MTARWRELQDDFLTNGLAFNCEGLAADWECSTRDASAYITAHVNAQRGPKARTKYVLRREGRTRAAVWHVTRRDADSPKLARQCMDDITVKIKEALVPDLHRLAAINPKAAPLVNALTSAFEANLHLLEAALP